MFGYVSVNPQALSEEEKRRFRGAYCGLCRALSRCGGVAGRLTLSNDMTFLALLLGALYEPEERCEARRCPVHPLKKHECITQEATAYAADMNLLLAYYKCLDDRHDERRLRGRAGCAALQKAYRQAAARYPRQDGAIGAALAALNDLERRQSTDLDALARRAGEMLGACFVWREDVFREALMRMGGALGRFVYLMDAYEDYAHDQRRGCFNPLKTLHAQPDYEARVEDILAMEMAQCVKAFDYLPIERDSQLLRNVLYSGVWGRYTLLRQKRKETTP